MEIIAGICQNHNGKMNLAIELIRSAKKNGADIAALSRGAKIIEKHFTLDKKMYGPDHASSMTPDELKAIHNFRLELEKCL